MSTIILNGSPKGNAKNSASYFLAQAFVSKMKKPCEIISIAKTDFNEVLERIVDYDNIIFFMPNYIHAMPGVVMKFLERFPTAENDNKALGFVVQSGYPEGIEGAIVSRFFEQFTRKLGYKYLGTTVKGEAAAIAFMPDRFKKLAMKFSEFGLIYEQTGGFDKNYMEEFAKPYQLTNFYRGAFNFYDKIGLTKIGWNMMLKKNNAYEKRFDKPYA